MRSTRNKCLGRCRPCTSKLTSSRSSRISRCSSVSCANNGNSLRRRRGGGLGLAERENASVGDALPSPSPLLSDESLAAARASKRRRLSRRKALAFLSRRCCCRLLSPRAERRVGLDRAALEEETWVLDSVRRRRREGV